jgi:hypothetical protein
MNNFTMEKTSRKPSKSRLVWLPCPVRRQSERTDARGKHKNSFAEHGIFLQHNMSDKIVILAAKEATAPVYASIRRSMD